MLDQLTEAFFSFAKEPAIKEGAKVLSYQELWEKVEKLRVRISSLDIKEGDILSCVPNPSKNLIALLLACLYSSVTLLLINRYLPPFFLKKMLQTLPIRYTCTQTKEVLLKELPKDYSLRGDALFYPKTAKKPFTIMFTAGSTGAPKLAVHSGENHLYSALAAKEHFPLAPGDVWLLSMPLYHVAGIGIIFRCLLQGACINVVQNTSECDSSVTHISFVDTTLRRFLSLKRAPSLRCAIIGGGPISLELENMAKNRLPTVFSYGLTEMSSHVCSAAHLLRKQEGTCFGKAHAYAFAKVQEGELYLAGKTRFLGYYKEPFLPTTSYIKTNDLARIDAEKRIWIMGRKDRLFISGGENIQPEEIENALLAIEGIARAKVTPVPDRIYGMRPIAVIGISKHLEEKEIKKKLGKELPSYKIPDKIFLEKTGISALQGKNF